VVALRVVDLHMIIAVCSSICPLFLTSDASHVRPSEKRRMLGA
jgi:hypothetical protein